MEVSAGRSAVCGISFQERLAKCHGSQCGFCTPGMVMSIYTLLRNHPEPTSEQMIAALAGKYCHLLVCRCVPEAFLQMLCVCECLCEYTCLHAWMMYSYELCFSAELLLDADLVFPVILFSWKMKHGAVDFFRCSKHPHMCLLKCFKSDEQKLCRLGEGAASDLRMS